jgi:hypothetical protein
MLVVISNLVCLYIWWQAFRVPVEASKGVRERASPATQD